MKRTRRSCVASRSIVAPKSPKKSKETIQEETMTSVKVKKEKKARTDPPLDILVRKNIFEDEEKMSSSSDESEIENQTPEKELKGQAYLNMIEENRRKRLALLKTLNIDEVKNNFCASVKALKPERVRRVFKPKVLLPPRKSARLAGVIMNLSEKALVKKALEEVKVEGDLKAAKIFPDKFEFEENALEKQDFSDYQKYISDLDFKDPPKPIQFPNHFKRMKSQESLVTKVVPGKVTALTVHPSPNQVIVTAGSKCGHIGFWNVTSNSPSMFHCHNKGITNLKFNTFDGHKLLSSSYDGRLLCGDMEKLIFEKYYGREDETCSCFDILSSSTFIVGHSKGDVAIVDCRINKNCFKTHNCHDYRIKRVSVHPVDTNIFASSDSKGIIKVWDLRKLTREPLCESTHHDRSVFSLFFSPATGKSLLSTCWDNSCCIFDSSDFKKGLKVENNIRHNNYTGRCPLQAVWVPNAEEQFFAIGSLQQPRRVEVFNRQGSLVHEFMDENLCSVLSLVAFHSSLPVLAGGNSSGKVTVLHSL